MYILKMIQQQKSVKTVRILAKYHDPDRGRYDLGTMANEEYEIAASLTARATMRIVENGIFIRTGRKSSITYVLEEES